MARGSVTRSSGNRRRSTKRKSNSTVAIVKSVLNSTLERKVYSQNAVATAVVTAGVVIPITNNIIEGDDIANRQGTVIRLARIRALFRGVSAGVSSSVRFILFRDMLNLQAFPTVGTLLPAVNWISQYADTRQIQQHRFKILHDLTLDLPLAGENVKTRQIDIPVKGTVSYNGTAAGATSEGPGAVLLLVIGSANTTNYDYTVQVIFTDA